MPNPARSNGRFLSASSDFQVEIDEEETSSGASSAGISRNTSVSINDEAEPTLFVAVGKESDRTLLWALKNDPSAKKVFLLHVHCPAKKIPMMGGSFPESQVSEQLVKGYRLHEREKMDKVLNKYMLICINAKVQAEKLVIEMDDVAKGLVDLIAQRGITRLVMGAAADARYSKKMKAPSSNTACTVRKEAHPSCKIWFVCKGNLICTRDAGQDGYVHSQIMASPDAQSSRAQTFSPNRASWFSPLHGLFTNRSYNGSSDGREAIGPSPKEEAVGSSTPVNRLSIEESLTWEGIPRSFQASNPSSWSGGDDVVSNLGSSSVPKEGESEAGFGMFNRVHNYAEDPKTSYEHERQEGTEMDDLYDKLQRALTEAATSKDEAYEESRKRNRAEREALMASRRIKEIELKYANEMKQRNETEEALAREKMELENLKSDRDKIRDELLQVQKQKSELETQITESDYVIKDLKDKLSSKQLHFDLLQAEQDLLHQKWDDAIKEVEELRCASEEASSNTSMVPVYSEFSYLELEQATRNFGSSLKIGEGGYGKVYKGFLRHTPVAIKMLHAGSLQGQSEFHQEINILSRVRHPNLVTLIGACSEAWALVYEFLPNGSLEDRLACVGNSPPLSWQVRTRILVEICCALIFLHLNKPQSVVHGDLKPANILLDVNYMSKLSDFGISRLLAQSTTNATLYRQTNPKGTFVYMDPEFSSSGMLTPQSDVYSFGIIILQILTSKPPLGIVKEVQEALNKGTLQDILDPTAGAWPFVQAQQLANLGIRCSQMNRKKRPDLVQEVWRVLEPIKNACLAPSSSISSEEDDGYTPSYFMCPIFQEVMRDPHVAADGFTYEAEALKGWLESGHETSPMTNLKLENDHLIPNHALRSAIQEWMQHRNQ